MKKVICILLAVVMAVCVLIGCGKQEETTTQPQQEPVKEETKAEDPAKEEAKEEAPTEWSEETWLPLSDGETLTVMRTDNAKVADWNEHNFTKWVEEVTGVNIDFKLLSGGGGEKMQQFSLMVAGGETLPDIIWAQFDWDIVFVNELGRDGYFVDLKPYMEDPGMMPYFNKAISEVSEANQKRYFNFITDADTGEIYNFPHYQDLMAMDNAQSMTWINQKWLNALGLEMPSTIDELHDVLVAFRDGDPNGNGKKDEIPMIGPNEGMGCITLGILLNAYVYFDYDYFMNVTDGQVWPAFTSDEFREALKTLNAWTAEGLISQVTYTKAESSDLLTVIMPESQESLVGVWAGHPQSLGGTGNAAWLEFDYLHSLKGETEKGGYYVWHPGYLGVSTMITCDCENVELAVKFCDYFFSDVASSSMRHGIKGKNWDYIAEGVDRTTDNIVVLDDGQAFFNGVDTWGGNTHAIMTNRNYIKGAATDDAWLEHSETMKRDRIFVEAAEENWPDEIITDTLTFSTEEKEFLNTLKLQLDDYLDESIAKFGTGVWDPHSDADWNTYLSELKTMGLDDYTAIYQSAYDKTK